MKYDKLLFLDFDGVCNSFKCGSILTSEPSGYGPDPDIINRIKNFCDETSSKIVITSNWRKFDVDGSYSLNGRTYKNPLSKLKNDLSGYIVDIFPCIRHIRKSEVLILWLEENDVNNFVILDDDIREGYHTTHDYHINKHFILTNEEFGFSCDDYEKAKIIINSQDPV